MPTGARTAQGVGSNDRPDQRRDLSYRWLGPSSCQTAIVADDEVQAKMLVFLGMFGAVPGSPDWQSKRH